MYRKTSVWAVLINHQSGEVKGDVTYMVIEGCTVSGWAVAALLFEDSASETPPRRHSFVPGFKAARCEVVDIVRDALSSSTSGLRESVRLRANSAGLSKPGGPSLNGGNDRTLANSINKPTMKVTISTISSQVYQYAFCTT
eukprot:6184387-Pleurochrysis_carterae.AAC.2